jgi:hypothetical protein
LCPETGPGERNQILKELQVPLSSMFCGLNRKQVRHRRLTPMWTLVVGSTSFHKGLCLALYPVSLAAKPETFHKLERCLLRKQVNQNRVIVMQVPVF